jgi:hypothetical protein
MEGREDPPSLVIGSQVVQRRDSQHDVEPPVRKFRLWNVLLNSRDSAGGRSPDPILGSVSMGWLRLIRVTYGSSSSRIP